MTRKITIGLASVALGVLGVPGGASAAPVDGAGATPSPGVTATPGDGVCDNDTDGDGVCDTCTGDGIPDLDGDGRQSGGHGAGGRGAELAADLAATLGMDEATVADALADIREEFRAARDTYGPPSETEREAHQEQMATSLADQLGVDEATVNDAIQEMQTARQEERRSQPAGPAAGAPGSGNGAGDGSAGGGPGRGGR